jgi:hypothetical protein
MFLELLMVLFVQIAAVVGPTGAKVAVLLFLILGTALFIFVFNWVFEYLFDISVSPRTILRHRNRIDDAVKEKAAQRKIELYGKLNWKTQRLNLAKLEHWCEEHTDDWAAWYKLSEMYEAAGDFRNFTRCREAVLKGLPSKGTSAEMAMEWHHVADAYLLELKDAEAARLALEYFVHHFSQTPEAV